ncbi:PREDICTED: uncharacterized protein LOC108564224 [Nicrophorus vespilloides]|uniref:Uncharacterized protein LOC108564224 n=1 Tax=Nicrophorus vespilloides TaxID=110193 RepID=A0ABM1MVS5_NICVS|nr:PREDICTED: uncharacterized protein LOC108564224 [Nicrophorus vespilloides]
MFSVVLRASASRCAYVRISAGLWSSSTTWTTPTHIDYLPAISYVFSKGQTTTTDIHYCDLSDRNLREEDVFLDSHPKATTLYIKSLRHWKYAIVFGDVSQSREWRDVGIAAVRP